MAGARSPRIRVRRPRTPPAPTPAPYVGPVAAALEVSIEAAAEKLTKTDAAGLAALRVLARMADNIGRPWYDEEEGRARPVDNVTMPTLLKYLDAYGLTMAARKVAAGEAPNKGGRPPRLASVSALLPGATG